MQVILNKDVVKVGRKGELVSVKPGYYRNFLGPQDLAVSATAKLKIKATEVRAQIEKENTEKKASATANMQALNTKTITVRGKLNAKGKLYKKVSNEMLIQAIEKDFGFKPAADMLKFDKNIKEEGLFDIVINLGFDQVAQAKIKVTGEKDSE